jgi:starvation-inducible DNA-binding protein
MSGSKAFKTRIGIARAARSQLVSLLNQQLADTLDLYTQTKQAHWNVRGAQFYQLHLLFDKLAGEVEGHADALAERAGALGGLALGTARLAAEASRLDEYPLDATSPLGSVDALVERYSALGDTTRAAIESAATLGDPATADLLTQIARSLDGALWFLEAHLQS